MPAQFATIEQIITAGSDWDGTEPTTEPVIANGIKSYPTHTAGGLFQFDFSTTSTLWEVCRLWVDFGGVAVKSVSIRRPGAVVVDIPIIESNLAAEVKFLLTDPIILTSDEQLIIQSTSAAAAMVARVTARTKLTLTEF